MIEFSTFGKPQTKIQKNTFISGWKLYFLSELEFKGRAQFG